MTQRLVMDPLVPSDLEALHAHWTQDDVRRYLWDGEVVTVEQVREVIRTSDMLFDEQGAGLWALRPTGVTQLIGCAGFWSFRDPPELELLVSLTREWWGRGLASEAANRLLEHAFEVLGWEIVRSAADAPNSDSLDLLRRLGMVPSGQRPGEFGTIEEFRITREQWVHPLTRTATR